ERKKIKITSNLDKEIIASINPDVLKTVLRNVLNNAIKYSHAGREVKIKAREEEDLVYITVEDEGIGMDDETRLNILKGNYLSSKPGTGSEKGSGLGLAICIDLLQMNKGELDIDNKDREGTCVILKILKANG
ncbi:MAG: ATP-binding protein, partial [Bacteroidales bacterium]|nr:ATP-binding protein [Bacteroidales bacterium]